MPNKEGNKLLPCENINYDTTGGHSTTEETNHGTLGGHSSAEGTNPDTNHTFTNAETVNQDEPLLTENVKVYKERWFILFLFCLFSLSNGYQNIQLNIIANIIHRYYNESIPGSPAQQRVAIDWLCLVTMLVYGLLAFPVIWILDTKGLRFSGILGVSINAVCALIKCGAVSPGTFLVLMSAQTMCAIAQVFVLGIPPQLAGVWFGPDEVSTATAIGLNALMVGLAVGEMLPPVIVPDVGDDVIIGQRLGCMFYISAGVCSVIVLMFFLWYKESPPSPPSLAALNRTSSSSCFRRSMKNLLVNRNFICITLSYGISTGAFYALTIKWNAIFLFYFEHRERDVGMTGLTMVIAGIIGSVMAGKWLDVTKLYRSTNLFFCGMTLCSMVALTGSFYGNTIWVIYVFAGMFGLFQISYQTTAVTFSAELTYPEPEMASVTILFAAAQLFGLLITVGIEVLIEYASVVSANIMVCVVLGAGFIITVFIPSDLRRKEVEKGKLS